MWNKAQSVSLKSALSLVALRGWQSSFVQIRKKNVACVHKSIFNCVHLTKDSRSSNGFCCAYYYRCNNYKHIYQIKEATTESSDLMPLRITWCVLFFTSEKMMSHLLQTVKLWETKDICMVDIIVITIVRKLLSICWAVVDFIKHGQWKKSILANEQLWYQTERQQSHCDTDGLFILTFPK